MSEYLPKVISILQNVPGFADVKASEIKLTRLGGLTNLVHRVEARGQRVVVRIPGDGTESYINRAVEVHNARAAEKAGVAPNVLWADAASGALVTRALDNIETMTPALFKSRPGSPARAGAALAKLHRSGQSFDFRFELFAMIDDYLKVLATKDVALPEGYHNVVAAAKPIREALEKSAVPLAPCHCDPLSENFLDDGARMWMVDWEYSGMNDPHWDIGDLSVEAEMDDAQEAELLHGYFGRTPTPAEMGRVVIYKAMCDLLWTLWGLIQLADKNPALDFRAYADGRFARCRALMNSPAFAGHAAAISA
ncbi:phosphotransferase family protein [Aestuariivirga litoralis]|uniref:phosphotransferase family protein n=1 Tax=Aestuariivirga litoralis TaxID=2650924 RepID=UPI0018C6F2D7|nr:phosphotransferase family protein [Aestuariivirga litoralis]MBG1233244.1 phosphotransferase family protein [Aestuariivirga litoralis]